ncbi:helix-turn-helix transcriptional regulator [Enhygromyxa salina]|uniref:Transcriptional activator FtrA n=1 Tax=Enhygromyxa salina TaxID=215803 RepID=A0A2S9YT27_9BACT|nr:helix-turn-helix transcriptional regulator [Enhygromyxa salina]PRQ08199.1 transcriptional activator FtrA [Enhygromyxa salina]
MRIEITRGAAWEYAWARPEGLRPWVDHQWAFRGPTVNRFKRVFPNGCVELIINFAEPYRTDGFIHDSVVVSGLSTAPLVIEQPAAQDVIAARLTPAGARALLGLPMEELAHRHVALGDLLGPVASELRDRCAGLEVEDRLRLLAAWLRARLQPHPRDAAAWMVDALVESRGCASIEALRNHAGFSKRRVLASFRDQVGLTPKRYARVLRFRHALTTLQGVAPDTRLIEVAHAAGFYDQAHMNAEFRALGGVTPSTFLRARHPVGDGSTAADR